MKLYDKVLLILILFTTNFLISQAPSQFTYQSVVRANSGSLVSNQEVSFRFTILKGTELGSIVFEEEHTVTTNINGLATMIIGKGSGTDDLLEIDWGIDSYFLKVEVDPEGGFNYIAEDTTQLLSVPFALYSNTSGSNLEITGQDYLSLNNNEITVNKIDLSDDVDGILPIANGGTGSSTAPMVAVITASDAAAARNVLGLSSVASSGSYNDLTDRLTAGTNIDITNGVISSTDTNTTYTAGTGIAIDGNNSISSTITQYTDADAQAALTAGTNIDITNGVISSTDTNTTYSVGDGGLTQNNFTDALKSKLDGLNTSAIYDNSGSPALETGITAAEIRSLIGVDTSGSDNSTNVTLAGLYDYLTLSDQTITLGQITNDDLAGGIDDSKLTLIDTGGKVDLGAIEIDGGTDINSAIENSDLIIIDDGGVGRNRKSAVSRLKTYIQSATSLNNLTDVLVQDESYYFGNEPTNTSSAEKNIGIGLTALDAITTGDYNIAIGSDALTNNTTGNNNTAIGRFAMEENTSGYQNTALGILALEKSTSSGNNVAVGHSSLNSITDGEKNVGISSGVAPSLTTGDKNVVIGYVADVSANNAQNQIVIGHEATGLGDNYAVIGDSDIERLYAAEDAGAVVYAGGINLSGGNTVSAVKFGTVTMSTSASQAFTVSGVTSNSIVTASFKSGDNGRYIKTVVPSTDTITITLDNPADGGVIMYIIIN